MPLANDDQFLKGIYRQLGVEPLQPGDPRYQPVYQSPGCEDPMELLQRAIEFADVESLHLFSGFRGSGKTTELYRLRKNLEELGYVVLYADALDYLSPATPIGIADLLMLLAGSFSDALEEQKIDLRGESYWTRLGNYLKTTSVNLKEIGLKSGAELKLDRKSVV